MKVMVIVKASKDSEAGVLPSEQLLSVAGFWLWKVKDMEEAVDWIKRCPNPHNEDGEIEIRQVFDPEDFAPIDPTGEHTPSRISGRIGFTISENGKTIMGDAANCDLDLGAYLERIGYTGPREPSLAVLDALHLAHATRIPFENLDIQLGRPISIDLTSIQAKLVQARRGGYCFEQNTLLAAVLEQLGFGVTLLSARVRLGANRVLPRTHMLLLVDVAGERWLADVGFGTGGLLKPLRLLPGEIFRQFSWSFRLREEGGNWALESLREGAWQDLYVFTLEPHYPIDFEMANHYISTHPASRFVQTLAVQKQTPEACHLLRNRELTIIEGDKTSVTEIGDDEALLAVLADTFGLDFPPGTRFRCLGGQTSLD